jgi:chaperonin GroES
MLPPRCSQYALYVILQVVAVGSGKANEKGDVVKPTLSKGDTVLYQKYSGVDFEGENERQYVVLKENDILASLA